MMDWMSLLDWLATWPGAVWLQGSGRAYLFVNAAHILGIGLLVGAILPFDLILVGVIRSVSPAVVGPLLLRSAAAGLALAVATGLWLFTVEPRKYVDNPAFLAKLALLGLALVNIAVQYMGSQYLRSQYGGSKFGAVMRGEAVPFSVRVTAGLSALLWLSVLVAGRWIGFV